MTSIDTFLSNRGWDSAATRRAFSLALASWLAFSIASTLHVHNAYWAAMPVWVISQPTRGVLLERALWRVVGTVTGAAFGFALLHLPIPPALQLTLLALWIAAHGGLIHLHRGVHGYGASLAGLTAAIVAVPSILAPSASKVPAMARIDCTLIGVIVGTLVMALLTPDSPLADFYAQVRSISAEAVAYAAQIVKGGSDQEGEERRILDLISQLESAARMNAAGSMEGYRRQRHVDLLVVSALSAMAAARDVRDGQGPTDPDLPRHMERIACHLRKDWKRALPLEEQRFKTGQDAALLRLEGAIGDLLAADQVLSHPDSIHSGAVRLRESWLAPHREGGLALRSGALTGAVCLAATLLALWSGWPPLGLMAMGVCIFTQVLSSMPLPQLIAPKLVTGVILGAVVAIGYRICIQPHLATSTGLLLTLIPFLIAGGFARTHPRVAPISIDAIMCFLMSSQLGMPAIHSIPPLLRDTAAMALAAGIAASLFLVLPRNPRRQARDAALVIRRDLQRILELDESADPTIWHARGSRQILRLSLHLGRAQSQGKRLPRGFLATLNLGQAMIDLQLQGMPEPVRILLNSVLRQETALQEGVKALKLLAGGCLDEARSPRILRLADTLEQASGLLTFGLSK